MTRFVIAVILCLVNLLPASAQPDTEVYLLDLQYLRGKYVVSNPISVSLKNPGYDNQPSFSKDSQFLYYVATRDGQTDIVVANVYTKTRKWLSDTPEGGEYSPNLSPDKQFISAVQLENSGRQLLWRYSADSEQENILIPDAKIGYYAWVNPNMLVGFVLGEPNTLEVFDVSSGTKKKITENVGRSIHLIPKSSQVSYISKQEEEWNIMSLNPKTGKTKPITCSLTGSEDMAWTPQKHILMGKEGKLYVKNPKKDEQWKEITSFAKFGFTGVTRLAVSPDGTKLAVVVSE